jgi:hypothetical protein
MKNRRLIALAFGTCFLLICTGQSRAQTTGTTTGGTGGTTGGTGGIGGVGSTGAAGSTGGTSQTANVVQTLTTSQQIYSATGAAGSATTMPSSSNPFALTYVSPYSLGLPTNYSTLFGAQNVINQSGGPKGSYTYLYTAPSTATTSTSTTATTANGFTTYGTVRSPVYATVLSDNIPVPVHTTSEIRTKVQSIIERSSMLKNKGNIQVTMDGNTVVLSGQVPAREIQLVEGMVRLTPGVSEVRNQLQPIAPK